MFEKSRAMSARIHPAAKVSAFRYLQYFTKILASSLLTFILISSGPSSCNAIIEERFIRIPALKRVAHLGDLYNEKTDFFIPVGLFRRTIPNEFITQIQNPDKRTYIEITDSLIDQLNFLGIDKNTGVNILAGITKPQGALSIIKGKSFQQGPMTGTLLHKYQTVVQTLRSFQDGLKENYNKDVMRHLEATHVVTQIVWGSQAAVQVQVKPEFSNLNDVRNTRNLLKAELRSLRGQLATADEIPSNFSMTLTSDVLLSVEIPTTGQQVKEILSQVPTLIADLNEGKGIPLSYTLTPINQIREHLSVIRQNTTAHKLNEFTLNEIIEVFQDLQSAEVQLHKIVDRIKSYSNCIPQQAGIKLLDLQTKFRHFKTNFTTTVKNSLIQVRSGLSENTILTNLVDQFSESDFEPHNLRGQVEEFDKDLKKIQFCRNFQNSFSNIRYFGAVGPGPEGQEEDLINSLTKMQNSSENLIWIFFTKFEFVQNEPTKYMDTFKQVFGKLNGTASTAVFVDCDFPQPFCNNITETSVFQYQNGVISVLEINSTETFPTCSKGSCLNGGTCIEGGPKIICECAAGFIGEYCEDIECAYPGFCTSGIATKPPSCKCRQGYVKDVRDPAKCQSSNNNATLLYGDAAGIQQMSIIQRTTTRIISETAVDRALDFHYGNQRMFWSASGGKIYSAPIFAGASKTLVLADTGSSILTIAIDWVHNNIYCTDDTRNTIFVIKLDGSMKKILINTGLSHTTGIVVNPLNGWMYWSDHTTKKIERAGMDGTRRQTITTHSEHLYGLTLDYTENRLYWTTYSPHPCSIFSMKPDGSDLKLVLRAAPPTFPSGSGFWSITIFQDYMYWRCHSTKKIYRANKCNGEELTEFVGDPQYSKTVQVYHVSKQPHFQNQCANRVIQCSHLCLPIPGTGTGKETLSTICSCPDGRTLSSNRHTCS